MVEQVRKAWHEGTPDSFKATLGAFAWIIGGIVLVVS
jgi:hypothetical protein